MVKKYELTDERHPHNPNLRRIRALVAIGALVSPGDLGGYIKSEKNLDHSGDAWVSGNACVSGNARVYGDACVSGNARVYGDAWVSGDARVSGDAWVSGNARVYGDARVSGDAWVSGNARVYGDAWVSGNACVYGDAWVSGNARVYGDAAVIWIAKLGSANRTLTAFCTTTGIHFVTGCFYGSAEEFRAKVRATHGDSQTAQEYLMAADLCCLRLKNAQEALPT